MTTPRIPLDDNMKTAILILSDGYSQISLEPRPGWYMAASHWTRDEALDYATTGRFPERLLRMIRSGQVAALPPAANPGGQP